eukprot:586718-Prorocentrum_minimum.AAC.3
MVRPCVARPNARRFGAFQSTRCAPAEELVALRLCQQWSGIQEKLKWWRDYKQGNEFRSNEAPSTVAVRLIKQH